MPFLVRLTRLNCMKKTVSLLLLLWPLLVTANEDIRFNRDIRPILSENCYACHGPDENQREGRFRLDVKESAFGKAESGERPLVARNVKASHLYQRISSKDPDFRMPPADSAPKQGRGVLPLGLTSEGNLLRRILHEADFMNRLLSCKIRRGKLIRAGITIGFRAGATKLRRFLKESERRFRFSDPAGSLK